MDCCFSVDWITLNANFIGHKIKLLTSISFSMFITIKFKFFQQVVACYVYCPIIVLKFSSQLPANNNIVSFKLTVPELFMVWSEHSVKYLRSYLHLIRHISIRQQLRDINAGSVRVYGLSHSPFGVSSELVIGNRERHV